VRRSLHETARKAQVIFLLSLHEASRLRQRLQGYTAPTEATKVHDIKTVKTHSCEATVTSYPTFIIDGS
jgi:hypothetical protein